MRYASRCWTFAVNAQCVPLALPQAHPRPEAVQRCLATDSCGLGKAHRTLPYRPGQNCTETTACIGGITHMRAAWDCRRTKKYRTKDIPDTEELSVGHSLRVTPAASFTGFYGETTPPVDHFQKQAA